MVGPLTAYVEVNGIRGTYARVHVPGGGRWLAEVDLDGTDVLPTTPRGVTFKVGQASFVGTYDPEHSGTFGLRRRLQIIGGADGWDRIVPARALQNDAGIKLSTVLQGIATEVGETVANIPDERIGVKFVRAPQSAAAYLFQFLAAWHIDYAGVTQCRAPVAAALGDFQLLEFNPRERLATIAAIDPSAVTIGAVLTTRLDTPFTVRSLDIIVAEEQARIYAWGT